MRTDAGSVFRNGITASGIRLYEYISMMKIKNFRG
jgi:hypothetical protein